MVLMNLSIGQQWRCRHREQSFGHSLGERRWDNLWEQHWNIYITVCKVDSQWEFAVWHREPKASALWQPRVGWGGRREAGSGRGGHVYTYGWFMLMYSRKHHNIVIILQLKIKQKENTWKPGFIKASWRTLAPPWECSMPGRQRCLWNMALSCYICC